MKRKIFVILGNQLFKPSFFQKYKTDHIFFMCEDYELCTYQKHHKHKILLFLSSMRSFSDELKEKKFELIYKKLDDDDFTNDYVRKLILILNKKNIEEVSLFEVEDKNFESKLLNGLKRFVKINYLRSPMFLTTREEFKEYISSVKKPFMAQFYKLQRKKFNLLMDSDNKPLGGKWSFDEDNRKKLPKDINLPKKYIFEETEHTKELKILIKKVFSNHQGSVENFNACTIRDDVQKFLSFFIDVKFENFGDYEDSVDKRDNILFHSALSPYINMGLLTPMEIIEEIKKKPPKKLNSYEGFIRQLIGWREFIRGIYQNYDKELECSNFFNHKKKMKASWYDATTGLEPLDYSIKNALNYGWTHHIERLMILCNIMNLCELDPKDVFNWFMEMFVDSSEWVMAPNVFGMGLFSDGGIFSTKPYICGSSYFLKIMHFKKGPWCDIMDGLYWRFIDKNKDFFIKNRRLSMMVRILEKMNKERKNKIFSAASNFIESNTHES